VTFQPYYKDCGKKKQKLQLLEFGLLGFFVIGIKRICCLDHTDICKLEKIKSEHL